MAQRSISAANRVLAEMDRDPVPDGVRRVVEMRRSKNVVWHVDVGESESDDHARALAEAMSRDNGGRWKFVRVLDRFPHEADDESDE